MDKRKSILNVTVSILFKLVIMVTTLIVRRVLIGYIGNDVNGLNSLYTSIIGFLSVAELGVGTAISYCMYRPIVENNKRLVAALYGLFRKIYLVIGGVILLGGIVVAFFLPYLAADYADLDVNVYFTFFLALVATVLTYGYSSKVSLINAYKDNYITTSVTSACHILRDISQIVVIILTRSFVLFLLCAIATTILDWIFTSLVTKKRYGEVIIDCPPIDNITKQELIKNIKAMFTHKVGTVLVNTADSVIISAFIGVVVLGKYSNYTVISSYLVVLISLFFTPLTAVIGHMCAESNKEVEKNYFSLFYAFNYLISMVSFLGYYAIIDNMVTIIFGLNLEMAKPISLVITINQFIQFLRKTTLTFRDATGVFYYDRWKPLIEGIVNVALSILFVIIFPDEYKVVGIIVATIITNLFVCHIIEPYVLYKHEFQSTPIPYIKKNYILITIFIAALFLLNYLMISTDNEWLELFINGFLSVGVSALTVSLICVFNRDFRREIIYIISKIFQTFCNAFKQVMNKRKSS